MSHPQLFADDDPLLARVRSIALAFPEAAEKISHGRPAFFTKKVFAYFGAALRIDGMWIQHDQSLVLLLDQEEHRIATQDPRFFVPAYFGPSGWLGIDLDVDTDWQEIAELIDSSYRQTASAKLISRLDG
jgi:predicted DNA-binding protein (MmcQ/YjbR family)